MRLHKAGEGLLKTHVTWDDVMTQIQKDLGTSSVFGDGKTVTDLGDMKGAMSVIGLLVADWQGEDAQKLPSKFVVKIGSQLAFAKRYDSATATDFEKQQNDVRCQRMTRFFHEYHDCEVEMYNLFEKYDHPNLSVPKIYTAKNYDSIDDMKAFIVMEYIENLVSVGAHEPISVQDLMPVVRGVTALQAFGEKLSSENRRKIRNHDFVGRIFNEFLDQDIILHTKRTLEKWLPEKLAEKVSGVLDVYTDPKFFVKLKNLPEYLGIKPVLVHSDLWSMNMLWERRSGEGFDLRAIIDWQSAAFSHPAQDLCRLLISCLGGQTRRDHWESILKQFYSFLLEELGDTPAPYTFDQLEESYFMYFSLSAFFVLPGMGCITDVGSPKDREKAEEKVVAMAEDLGPLDVTLHCVGWNLRHPWTTCKFGPGLSVERVGEGVGFMSRMALIRPDWQGDDVTRLPEKFVVKISSQLAMIEANEGIGIETNEDTVEMPHLRQRHNLEVHVYELFGKHYNPDLKAPKIFACKRFDNDADLKGFIIMEHFENIHLMNYRDEVPLDDIVLALRPLAALQALGVKLSEEQKEFLPVRDFADYLVNSFFDEKMLESAFEGILSKTPAQDREKLSELLKFYSDPGFCRKLSTLPDFWGIRPVLAHNDMWLMNALWTKKEDGGFELRAIVDWQEVSLTHPVQDVCRFFSSLFLEGQQRQNCWECLLSYFYTFLENELGGRKAPYSFQQLVECYKFYLPVACFLALTDLEYDKGTTEIKKRTFIIQDLFKYHHRNVEKYPDFYKTD
ncbi:unnamed protein product [Caenorhabditis auriculariae]|uniref:CHK kinase-like domain-containing protein n=1 Tax=Caenorhabditis auriculariae TaxID=2777116 RepID=A0A8S1H2A5_9PELO|nr:unnamed protein product [Caenorhabditis auriculariae]